MSNAEQHTVALAEAIDARRPHTDLVVHASMHAGYAAPIDRKLHCTCGKLAAACKLYEAEAFGHEDMPLAEKYLPCFVCGRTVSEHTDTDYDSDGMCTCAGVAA